MTNKEFWIENIVKKTAKYLAVNFFLYKHTLAFIKHQNGTIC